MSADPIIELRNVSKTFRETSDGKPLHALRNMNLSIEAPAPDQRGEVRGQFVVLLGPSGCGKSTILSLISGLALPDEGEVFVSGELVRGPGEKSATVPQAYTCFPWLTAQQNVEFGLSLRGDDPTERRRRAGNYLRKVQLGDWLHAYHRHLSGGMQQRVAIARTLVMKRPIVLLDEPFGALDAQTRMEMQQMLLRLWDEAKCTIVFVTHDIQEALLLADRVIVFSPLPARILEDGDLKNLSDEFGYNRPPELVNDARFIRLAAKLRELLKPPTTMPPPAPKFLPAASRYPDVIRGSAAGFSKLLPEWARIGKTAVKRAEHASVDPAPVPVARIVEAGSVAESTTGDGSASATPAITHPAMSTAAGTTETDGKEGGSAPAFDPIPAPASVDTVVVSRPAGMPEPAPFPTRVPSEDRDADSAAGLKHAAGVRSRLGRIFQRAGLLKASTPPMARPAAARGLPERPAVPREPAPGGTPKCGSEAPPITADSGRKVRK